MGFRFRKSVKICKGVKVNFSKSGASLSIGGRGHSVTVGKRSRVTFGIPGTGLSYSKSLSTHHKSHKSSGRSTMSLPNQVHVILNDDGKIELRDQKNMLITDPSVVRKIKSTDFYKNTVQNLKIQYEQKLDEMYSKAKEENDEFINIYKQSPQVDSVDQYLQVMNNLRPPVYNCKEYDVPCPTEASVREMLISEAKKTVTGNLFKVGKLRKEYVETNVKSRVEAEISKWKTEKLQFDIEEKNMLMKKMRDTMRNLMLINSI